MSSEKTKMEQKLPGENLGWSSGLRIALILTLISVIISAIIYGMTYRALAKNLAAAEYEAVKTQAEEYSNWFLEGEIDTLDRRMNELRVQDGEIKFVRIQGPRINYIKYISNNPKDQPSRELSQLDGLAKGVNIPLAGQRWTIATVPVGNSGVHIQAGRNTYHKDQILAKFSTHVMMILLPGTLAFILCGCFLVYRGLLPIRRLIETIRDILVKGDLSRRAATVKGENELNALVLLFNHLIEKNEKLIVNMRTTLDHVAHDFRTPLSHLSISAEQALNNEGTLEEARIALADCAEETQNLRQMMDTVLDVAEAESSALELRFESVEIQSVIGSIIELYEFVSEEKGITLIAELPEKELMIDADRNRLTRALANLLDNAIKYSPENSEVSISVHQDDDQICIRFQDQGIGISQADLELIWQRLYRAEKSRTTKGLGLGLNYVKAIIEAHGGQITVTSVPENGSSFEVNLPI